MLQLKRNRQVKRFNRIFLPGSMLTRLKLENLFKPLCAVQTFDRYFVSMKRNKRLIRHNEARFIRMVTGVHWIVILCSDRINWKLLTTCYIDDFSRIDRKFFT